MRELLESFAPTHDAMFSALAADLARVHAIFMAILPWAVARQLIGPPEAVAADFLNGMLHDTHGDLLFRYRLKGGGQLYILLEHKSRPDRRSAMQMHGYHASIWRLADDGSRMPAPVIPLLMYNGSRPWQRLPDLAELIEGEGPAVDLARELAPSYRPRLVDMKALPRRQLRRLARNPEAWAGWMALVCGGQRQISRRQLRAILKRLKDGTEFEAQTIWYIVNHCDKDLDMVKTIVQEVKGKRGRNLMYSLDELEEEFGTRPWWIKAKKEAIAEGMAQGMAQGKAETLLSQLRLRFGDLPESAQGRVSAATPAQLDAWAAAVLTAASLDETLAATPRS